MSEKELPQIILSKLESKYAFLGLDSASFSDVISEVDDKLSLKKNLLNCEEKLAKKILFGKDFDKNIKLVKKYLKTISSSGNYRLLEKIKLIALFFSGAEDLDKSLLYKDVLTSNMYIRTMINSIEEDDIQKLFDCDDVVALLEDFEKFNQEADEKNRKTDTFVSGNDEFTEIVNTYRESYPDLLTPEKEKELLIRASEYDKYAKNELVGHNWRLVLSIAKEYIGRGLPLTDLFQEGNIGLMKAIDKFDVSKSLRLSTYATWWIRQGITRYVEDNSRTIRYPVHVAQKVYNVRKVYNALAKQYGANPSMQDVADVLDMDVKRVIKLFNLPDVTASLNQVIGDDEDTEFQDFLADINALSPEEYAEKSILKEEMAEYLSLLPKRQEQVLRLRFGFDDGKPKTLEIVGSELGVTRERIRQIEATALRRLKRIIESKKAAAKVAAYSRPNASRKSSKSSKSINTPYDYYIGNSPEDIDSIASTLPEELQEIYKKRFSEECDENTKVIFMGRVDYPMRARLAGLKRHSNDKERYIREVVKYNDRITTAPLDKIGITDAYKYFEDYPAEDVSLVAESLPEDLKKMYDERFSGGEVTRNQQVLFTKRVAPIMRSRLKALALHQDDKVNYLNQLIEKKERYGKCQQAKTVYEYFDKYTPEEVDAVIATLSDNNKELLALRFSEDDCSDEIKKKFSYFVSNNMTTRLKYNRMKSSRATEAVSEEQSAQTNHKEQIEIVNNDEINVTEGKNKMGKRGKKPAVTIYEYFKKYPKEQIDQIVESLPDTDKAIIDERFGEGVELTKVVMDKFAKTVGRKVNLKLKKLNNVSKTTIVDAPVIEEKSEDVKEQKVAELVDDTKKDSETLEKDVKPTTEKVEDVICGAIATPQNDEISPIFKTPLFMEKTRDLPYESLVAVALRLGFVGGREYSIESISNFLGMEVETVSQIVTTTLDSYKKDIVNMFYNAPSRSEKGISYTKKPSTDNKN